MNLRNKETLILALVALLIAGGAVGLILLVFLVSGQQDIIKQMFQSTAEGEFFGVAFTAGGPFAMWIIAFLLLWRASIGASLRMIRLDLQFPDSKVTPPLSPADIDKTKCWYQLLHEGIPVGDEKEVTIQTEKVVGMIAGRSKDLVVAYIYVKVPKIENPEYQFRLEYGEEELRSDSYSPKKGIVNFR